MLTKKVLVLGAGSAAPFRFPLGPQLRSDIINLALSGNDVAVASRLQEDLQLQPFVEAFSRSHLYSVDAFLGVRTEFAEIGKKAIAAILLQREAQALEQLMRGEGDWYAYLWNKIASGKALDEIRFDMLSIVTFNYDRSLELFLVNALRHTYGVSEQSAVAALARLQIVHVHGSLGPLWGSANDPKPVPFGHPIDHVSVSAAARSLLVIPEARDDSDEFLQAQAQLAGARSICFLGFGFDEKNLARLRSTETCSTRPGSGDRANRIVGASCLKMTDAEVRRAAALCKARDASGREPHTFVRGNCLEALRETLILG